jgi:Zn finger protein HypA/HybF involved in hydrogenase expression
MEMREYMEGANKWHKNKINKIWRKVYAKSMESLGATKKKFFQKFVHNELPSNNQQNKSYKYRNSICQACNDAIETQQHILICTACPQRNKIRIKYIPDQSLYLDNQRTNNATKIVLLQKVQSILNLTKCDSLCKIIPDATNALKTAVTEQDSIGWDHWLKGRFSQEWAALVNYDIETIDTGIRYSLLEKWATGIIDLNWELVQT